MNEDKLFLAQYNQVWEQRRQHVGLYWKIPIISLAFVTFIITIINYSKISLDANRINILFVIFIPYLIGVVRIYLRHNFFQRTYGLLLQDLENGEGIPIRPLPQFGTELRDRYQARLKGVERLGSQLDGMDSWIWIMITVLMFGIFMWAELTSIPLRIVNAFIY